MSDRPQPETRYEDRRLQRAYEQGWRQMYEHDSFPFLERIEGALPIRVRDEARRCQRRAAMLEGAADALLELADAQHEGAVFARAWEEAPPA